MKLTWHIVMKDLRRLRYPLAGWIALFAIEYIVGVRLLKGYGGELYWPYFERLQAFNFMLIGLRAIGAFILIAMLVLEDGLGDTAAFWPTRPISGARLLGSKLLSCVAIFAVLPVVVTLPWWLYCDYGVREIFLASQVLVRSQILPDLVAFTIAALTWTMGRFLMWTFFAGAAVLLTLVTLPLPSIHLFIHGTDIGMLSGIAATRILVLYILSIAGCCCVIIHHFLTRRLARSLVITAVAIGLLVLVEGWWPWNLMVHLPRTAKVEANPPLNASVKITTKYAHLYFENELEGTPEAVLQGSFSLTSAPADTLLRFGPTSHEWHWPGGGSSLHRGNILGSTHTWSNRLELLVPHPQPKWWGSGPVFERFRTHRNFTPGESYEDYLQSIHDPYPREWDYGVEVSPNEGRRMLSEPSTYSLHLQGELLKSEIRPEIPLVVGSEWSGRAEGTRITGVKWDTRTNLMTVAVVDHHAAMGSALEPYSPGESDSVVTYIAINRKRGESAGSENPSFSGLEFSMQIATVGIEWRRLRFAGPSNLVANQPEWSGGKWNGPSYQDWFSDATLARVVQTVTGGFSRTVTVDPFLPSSDTKAAPR